MLKKYRVAAIGFAHSHMTSNLKSFAECGGRVEFVAAADVMPKVKSVSTEKGTRLFGLQNAIDLYGFKKYDDYEKLLEENQLDIVLVCSENALHSVVMEKILSRGINVVVEKPLAASMEGALRIARAAAVAAAHNGAKVITNWPTAWSPAVRAAKKIVDSGAIGRVFKFCYRNADSQGPMSYGQNMTDTEKGLEWWHHSDTGGGALLDYCCYGACMSSWFIGRSPVAAYGLKANFDSPYGSAEDYASITVRFPEAVAQLEGSWTTVNSGVHNGPLVFGTNGTLVVRRDGAVEIYKKRHSEIPDEVITPEPLPSGRETLGMETIHHLDTGEPLFPMLDLGLNLTAMSILDAGIRSAQTGKMELINDGVWCIGNDSF
ncbi:MAG: Gfo/Idh/MocA family oxidoreductase [Treponema sp.]|nr:Gfo/Idh/MocA family oxidoreductase [Treponema sp.]